jgi:hypothetical protein
MTLSPFYQSKGQPMEREIYLFISIFAPTLGGCKCHFSDLKWGQKWKKEISLYVDRLFD